MIPSMVLWPVPYRLSNIYFVWASLTAMMGNRRTPLFAMALRRMTPVVVSSVPPRMPLIRSLRFEWIIETRSAPSSIVMCGFMSSTEMMCR